MHQAALAIAGLVPPLVHRAYMILMIPIPLGAPKVPWVLRDLGVALILSGLVYPAVPRALPAFMVLAVLMMPEVPKVLKVFTMPYALKGHMLPRVSKAPITFLWTPVALTAPLAVSVLRLLVALEVPKVL